MLVFHLRTFRCSNLHFDEIKPLIDGMDTIINYCTCCYFLKSFTEYDSFLSLFLITSHCLKLNVNIGDKLYGVKKRWQNIKKNYCILDLAKPMGNSFLLAVVYCHKYLFILIILLANIHYVIGIKQTKTPFYINE